MKEECRRAEQSTQFSSESHFDCLLKEALTLLYERRAELNRLIRYLDAAQREAKAGNPNRLLMGRQRATGRQ